MRESPESNFFKLNLHLNTYAFVALYYPRDTKDGRKKQCKCDGATLAIDPVV